MAPSHDDRPARPFLMAGIVYLGLLTYGTLYPFRDWTMPQNSPWQLLLGARLHESFTDVVTNVLVYIPAGALLCLGALGLGRTAAMLLAAGACTALSLSLEYVQAFLPHRVPSILDLALNAGGGTVGAVLAVAVTFLGGTPWLARAAAWSRGILRAGPATLPAGAACALWVASQWAPFVPSLDVGNLVRGVRPLLDLGHSLQLDPWQIAAYFAQTGVLGVLASILLRNPYRAAAWVAAAMAAVLAGKILIVGRAVSPEAALGIAAGCLAVAATEGPAEGRRLLWGFFLVLAAAVLRAVHLPLADQAGPFNWIPFRMHLRQTLIGLQAILESLWPYVALGALAVARRGRRPGAAALVLGGAGCIALAGCLEWVQRWQPGRVPDITDLLLATAGWLGGALLVSKDTTWQSGFDPGSPGPPGGPEGGSPYRTRPGPPVRPRPGARP